MYRESFHVTHGTTSGRCLSHAAIKADATDCNMTHRFYHMDGLPVVKNPLFRSCPFIPALSAYPFFSFYVPGHKNFLLFP